MLLLSHGFALILFSLVLEVFGHNLTNILWHQIIYVRCG